jgi:uncharacterized protein YjiS (DUF1127 family)
MNASRNPSRRNYDPMDLSFEYPGGHWHQPALPSELRDPIAAFASAMDSVLCKLRVAMQRVTTTLSLWAERERSRRELEALSDYTLRDIGLTRADVWREASKPWWRA